MLNNNGEKITMSIIVPLAAGELLWRELFSAVPLPSSWEILFAAAESPPDDFLATANRRWLHCPNSGRGVQMNFAAAAATGEFLWFVHADSRLPSAAAEKLTTAIRQKPSALHYFSLAFYDGGWKMRLNEIGVRLRCAFFHNPFGDQSLCLSRRLFNELGRFCETAGYGEDHLFVLRARKNNTEINRVDAEIKTSARRYIEQGWWKTVFRFQQIWWRQWRRNQRQK